MMRAFFFLTFFVNSVLATSPIINYYGFQNKVYENVSENFSFLFSTYKETNGIFHYKTLENISSLYNHNLSLNVYLEDGYLHILLLNVNKNNNFTEQRCENFGKLNNFKRHNVIFKQSNYGLKTNFELIIREKSCILEIERSLLPAETMNMSTAVVGLARTKNKQNSNFYGCLVTSYEEKFSDDQWFQHSCDPIFYQESNSLNLEFKDSFAELTTDQSSNGTNQNILNFIYNSFDYVGVLFIISTEEQKYIFEFQENVDVEEYVNFCVTNLHVDGVNRSCSTFKSYYKLFVGVRKQDTNVLNFFIGNSNLSLSFKDDITPLNSNIFFGYPNLLPEYQNGKKSSALGVISQISIFSSKRSIRNSLKLNNRITSLRKISSSRIEENIICLRDTGYQFKENEQIEITFECSTCKDSSCSEFKIGNNCLEYFNESDVEQELSSTAYFTEYLLNSSNINFKSAKFISIDNSYSNYVNIKSTCKNGIDWILFKYGGIDHIMVVKIESMRYSQRIELIKGSKLKVKKNSYKMIDENIISVPNIYKSSYADKYVFKSAKHILDLPKTSIFKKTNNKMIECQNFTLRDIYDHKIFIGPPFYYDSPLILYVYYFKIFSSEVSLYFEPVEKNITININNITVDLGSKVAISNDFLEIQEEDRLKNDLNSIFEIVAYPKCGKLEFKNNSEVRYFNSIDIGEFYYISMMMCDNDSFTFQDSELIDRTSCKNYTMGIKIEDTTKHNIIGSDAFLSYRNEYVLSSFDLDLENSFLNNPLAEIKFHTVPEIGYLTVLTKNGIRHLRINDTIPVTSFYHKTLKFKITCVIYSSENITVYRMVDQISFQIQTKNELIISNMIYISFYAIIMPQYGIEYYVAWDKTWRFRRIKALGVQKKLYFFFFHKQKNNVTYPDPEYAPFLSYNIYQIEYESSTTKKFNRLRSFSDYDISSEGMPIAVSGNSPIYIWTEMVLYRKYISDQVNACFLNKIDVELIKTD